jgi:hypothetical protein
VIGVILMNELVTYDRMVLAIQEAYTIDDARAIMDKAEQLRVYAKRAKDKKNECKAAAIRIRAERRGGQLLSEMENAQTGPRVRCPDGTKYRSGTPTLNELGVTKKESAKWQKLAGIPDEQFEGALNSQDIPTTLGTLSGFVSAQARKGSRELDEIVAGIDEPETPRDHHQILNEDFLTFAPQYDGPRFNLIHCDFPYGIDSDESGQNPSGYDDSAAVHEALLDCLVTHRDRLCADSCHIMFWCATNDYIPKFKFLTERFGFEVEPAPLVWIKPNTGIVPDRLRRPRRVYEWAFLASRGHRAIANVRPNALASPATKTVGHPHEKPEWMLTHFFEMLVDDTTVLLDPTAGSGSAIRAARSLGAKYALGLEKDPEHWEAANKALTESMQLEDIMNGLTN